MSWRAITTVTISLLAACSGQAVVDLDDGDGGAASSSTSSSGSSTSSSGSSTSSSGSSASSSGSGGGSTSSASSSGTTATCDDLLNAYLAALEPALGCDTCDPGPNPCSDSVLNDPCGCPLPANTWATEAVAAAAAAYQAWVAQGCGPYLCGQPCVVSNSPHCSSTGSDCSGICVY